MFSFTRNLFARKMSIIRGTRAIRKPAPRANLEVTSLEDRLVPSTITGFSFAEQQSFPTPPVPVSVPGVSASTLTTIFKSQVDQTWQAIVSGKQLIGGTLQNGKVVGGETLNQEVIDNIQSAAAKQGVTANTTAVPTFAQIGVYTASLDTSGADPRLVIQYHLGGNTLDFKTTTNTVFGSYGDPVFHVDYDLNLTINVTIPSNLSTSSTVTTSAISTMGTVTVKTNNVLVAVADVFGKNIVGGIANGIAAQQQNFSSAVDTTDLNRLLQFEAARGYTHLIAGLDSSGNLLLTGQRPNLVVNGGTSDSIVVNTSASGSVQVTASGQTGSFPPGFVKTIAVNTGLGYNSVKILSVPAGVKVSVGSTQGGIDTVTIGNGTLASVAGPVSVSHSSGSTSLTIDDSTDPTDRIATITNNSVQFSGLNAVSYSGNVTALKVLGGSGTNNFFVNSTAAGTPLSVLTGAGQNTVWVGSGSLAGIAGAVNVQHNNASGSTNLIIDDYKETGRNAILNSGSVAFSGVPTIAYSSVSALTVVGASGSNMIVVNSLTPGTSVTLYNTQHNAVVGAAWWQVAQNYFLPIWDIPTVGHSPILFG